MTVTLVQVVAMLATFIGIPLTIWVVGRLRAPYDQIQVENQLLIYRLEAEQKQKERDAQAEEAAKKRDDAHSKGELAEVADQALYVSKRAGRNRVTVAPPVKLS